MRLLPFAAFRFVDLFSHLTFFPTAFCDKIYNWCIEIVSFTPGDNGMPVYSYENNKLRGAPTVSSPGVLSKMFSKETVEA